MATDKKETVLRRLEKDGGKATFSRLLAFCAAPRETIAAACKELVATGKIREYAGKKKNSLIYTLPDAPDPRPAGTGNNQQQPAAVSKKASPKKKIGRLVEKKKAPAGGSSPPENGGGRTGSADSVYSAAIAALKRQRETIDRAIAALEEACR